MRLLKAIFSKCPHTNTRMIYGDEIIATIRAFRRPMLARVCCKDCGRPLYNVDLTEHPNYEIAS